MRKDKWAVYGTDGGIFTNLKDARSCARELSKNGTEYSITLIEEGCHYIEYLNGKCIRDGWTIKKQLQIQQKKEKHMVRGKWEITRNSIGGKDFYAVYRLIDADKVDYSGNREYATEYLSAREEAQAILDKL